MVEIILLVLTGIAVVLLAVDIVLTIKNKKAIESANSDDTDEKLEQLKTDITAEINKIVALNEAYLKGSGEAQKARIESLEKQITIALSGIDARTENVRKSVEDNLRYIGEQNAKSIEKMRETVDEKLTSTLETRINKSFEVINQSLSDVNKGLGDMQNLAKDVGGLKNVLQNVKIRGTWAEVQLDNLLAEMLTSDQYEKSVAIKPGSQERCDFAIVLPGNGEKVLLPIDVKFPQEDYQRIQTFAAEGNAEGLEKALKGLETRIKEEAKSISSKYISVPRTTDFALMYLPTEGLYAEVIRRDGLSEYIQRNYRVVVCGPNTLGAMLSSLQMGFKTVAIQKKSSEIRKFFLVFKSEFSKFTELLEKTRKKIDEASDTIDKATTKTRSIERRLGKVEIDSEDTKEQFIEGEVADED